MASAVISKSDSACNVVPTLALINGAPRALSTQIAEHFGKRHDNVIQSIKALEIPDSFRLLNFQETSVEVAMPKGGTRKEPAILMTRDGFTILVMGFTGKKAMDWKIRYMEAFAAMERELCKPPHVEVLPPSTLTPEQCRQIHDVMDAKMSAVPTEQRRGAYAGAWTRFNRHFRIAKYEQLPPEKFSEALEYLINMELRMAKGALPAVRTEVPRSHLLSSQWEMLNAEIHRIRESLAGRIGAIQEVYGKTLYSGQQDKAANRARYQAYSAAVEAIDSLMHMARVADKTMGALYLMEKAMEEEGVPSGDKP